VPDVFLRMRAEACGARPRSRAARTAGLCPRHQPEKLQTFPSLVSHHLERRSLQLLRMMDLMRHQGGAGCRAPASFRLRTFKTKIPKAKQTSGIPAREVYRLALHDPRRLCTCLPPIPPDLTSQVLANLSGAGHLTVALNDQDHAAWAALHPWAQLQRHKASAPDPAGATQRQPPARVCQEKWIPVFRPANTQSRTGTSAG